MLFALGAILPSFRGYRNFSGLETALLFMNEARGVPAAWLLLGAYASCAACIALALLKKGPAARIAGAACALAESALFLAAWSISGTGLLPAAWLGIGGLATQTTGAILGLATARRPTRSY
jgi:hypothetical protein